MQVMEGPQGHRGLFIAQLLELELIFECGFIHHTNTVAHMYDIRTQKNLMLRNNMFLKGCI